MENSIEKTLVESVMDNRDNESVIQAPKILPLRPKEPKSSKLKDINVALDDNLESDYETQSVDSLSQRILRLTPENESIMAQILAFDASAIRKSESEESELSDCGKISTLVDIEPIPSRFRRSNANSESTENVSTDAADLILNDPTTSSHLLSSPSISIIPNSSQKNILPLSEWGISDSLKLLNSIGKRVVPNIQSTTFSIDDYICDSHLVSNPETEAAFDKLKNSNYPLSSTLIKESGSIVSDLHEVNVEEIFETASAEHTLNEIEKYTDVKQFAIEDQISTIEAPETKKTDFGKKNNTPLINRNESPRISRPTAVTEIPKPLSVMNSEKELANIMVDASTTVNMQELSQIISAGSNSLKKIKANISAKGKISRKDLNVLRTVHHLITETTRNSFAD